MNAFLVALGRASVQGAVLVLLVLLVQRLFRRQLSARWRATLWLLPALRLLLPFSVSSSLSVFNLTPAWIGLSDQPPQAKNPASPFDVTRLTPAYPMAVNTLGKFPDRDIAENESRKFDPPSRSLSHANHGVSAAEAARALPASLPSEPPTSPSTSAVTPAIARVHESPMLLLLTLWAVGAVFLVARIIQTCRELNHELAGAQPVRDPRVHDLFLGCADELGVRSSVRLVESKRVTSPLLHGCLRPQLVLPVGLREQLSWDELRFVLLHELAHVQRRDILQNWLGASLQVLHWFNPLVWMAFARWRADRELACDALALEIAGESKKQDYGRTILRLLESSPRVLGAPAMVGILEDKRQLRERILMIAAFVPGRRWSLLAFLLILTLALGGLTDARRAVQAAARELAEAKPSFTPPLLDSGLPDPIPVTNGPALSIRVVNESGQVIKGAEILAPHQASFFGVRGKAPRWFTDERGTATIHVGEPPTLPTQQMTWFALSVRHSEYAPTGMSWSVEKADARSTLPAQIDVILKKGSRIGGTIRDSQGQPLTNVRVGITANKYSNPSGAIRQQTYSEYWSDPRYDPAAVTDANGRWSVSNFPDDLEQITMLLMRPDGALYPFSSYTPENPFTASGDRISATKLREEKEIFVLRDGRALKGQVLDPRGRPVPNLRISEFYNNYQPGSSLDFITDAKGEFELRNRQQRQILLIAQPEKFAMQSLLVTLPPEGTNVTMQLADLSPLTIQTVDRNGNALAGATISVDNYRSPKMPTGPQLVTGHDGKAVWTNAPVTDLALRVLTAEGAHRKVRLQATDSRTVRIEVAVDLAQEIRLTGEAVDADTGAPVKLSSLRVLVGDFAHPPEPQALATSKFDVPLRAEVFRAGWYPTFRLKFEAPGYVPFTTEWRDFHEGDWSVQPRLKRGGRPSATLLLADGTPASGAEVTATVNEQDFLFMNTPGKVWRSERTVRVIADEKGQFELQDPGFDGSVAITHEQGFLRTSTAQLRTHPQLTLQPWGRVEGTLRVGKQAGANAQLNLSGQVYRSHREGMVNLDWNFILITTSDNSGHFAFDKVPPGEALIYRTFDRTPGPTTETYQHSITVKPGETVQLNYGGTGRAVTGSVEGNADWKNDVHLLVLKQPSDEAAPQRSDYYDTEEFSKAYNAYNYDELARKRRNARSYWVNFNSDGSFRIDDVPPGAYELRIRVTEPPKTEQERFLPSSAQKEIASLTREVIVPAMPTGRSDEPLDLGVLELNWKGPRATQPAVSFNAQTLDGHAFDLDALRGKFVVLNFWTTWSDRSLEQMAEVSALHQQHTNHARVAFLGANLGDSVEQVRKFVSANRYTAEQVMLNGRDLATAAETLQMEALPATFLLNPQGQIVARDLRSDTLEHTLETFLQRPSHKKE